MAAPHPTAAWVVELLKKSSFLGHLPDAVLESVVRAGHQRRFAKGEEIFRRGEPGDSALVVLSGRLKVTNTTLDGREIGLNFLAAGDLVGEIALLDGRERTANVVALEASDVIAIRRRDLMPVLIAEPHAMLGLVEALCEKLRIATSIIEDSAHEMEGRLVKGLIRLASQHGVKSRGRIRIDLALSQTDLGNYIGLSRANVCRQLAHLKSDGIIDIDGSHIIIVDEAGLAKRALTGEHRDS